MRIGIFHLKLYHNEPLHARTKFLVNLTIHTLLADNFNSDFLSTCHVILGMDK
jgi:hypothetical protein